MEHENESNESKRKKMKEEISDLKSQIALLAADNVIQKIMIKKIIILYSLNYIILGRIKIERQTRGKER